MIDFKRLPKYDYFVLIALPTANKLSTNWSNNQHMKILKFSDILFIFLAGVISVPVSAFDYFQPLPSDIPVPDTNPQSSDKIELGKKLFFDPRLSIDGSLSCNSCHNLLAGGEDSRSFSIGYQQLKTRRSAPSLWNVAFKSVLYWDGRSKNLEEQTSDHLLDKTITGFVNKQQILNRISSIPGYQPLFEKAFGNKSKISLQNIAFAISSFERTLVTPDSRFDRFMRGEKNLLNTTEKRGKEEFRLSGCVGCHFGVNFSGPAPGPALKMGDGFYELFPNNRGSRYDAEYHLLDDKGIALLTNNPRDEYMWRVPSLRNIMLTAPYFHNGSARTIEEAIIIMGKTQYGNDLSKKQINDIMAFLNTLTGVKPEISLPRLPVNNGNTPYP